MIVNSTDLAPASAGLPGVDLQYPAGRRGAPAPVRVRDWVVRALSMERNAGELCIRFVDSAEGEALNQRYRQRHYPTNVLSFPAPAPLMEGAADRGRCYLGDIVICIPVVITEAAAQLKKRSDHYAHMVVHGLLHLLDYDHIEEWQAQRMEARERAILASFGIADPYALTRDPADRADEPIANCATLR